MDGSKASPPKSKHDGDTAMRKNLEKTAAQQALAAAGAANGSDTDDDLDFDSDDSESDSDSDAEDPRVDHAALEENILDLLQNVVPPYDDPPVMLSLYKVVKNFEYLYGYAMAD